MMKVCIYCNRKYPDGNITFHKFPSDKERRKKWLSAMKIPNEDIDKNSYLCSEHFKKETFSCQVVKNVVHRFLYINAVPSIFKEKCSKITEIESDSNKHVEKSKENQNSTMHISQQCEVEEEDCFYYKIENGVIHRYLRENLKTQVSSSVRDTNQEIPSVKGEEKLKSDLIMVNTEVADADTVHVEAPVKVELLPDIQLPIEIRNGEIFSKESTCDFKSDEEPKLIFEDIKMDAEEITFEQMNEYSNLNGINEVEISTCDPEPIEIDQQEETSDSEDLDVDADADAEEFEMDMDDVSEETVEDLGDKETTDKAKVKKTRVLKKDSMEEDLEEEYGDKSMKTLLYKCLENKDSSDLDVKLRSHTKLKLTELLKTALNYIECLEDKLTITTEKNSQYEMQILELENLLQSISDSETSKTNSV